MIDELIMADELAGALQPMLEPSEEPVYKKDPLKINKRLRIEITQ